LKIILILFTKIKKEARHDDKNTIRNKNGPFNLHIHRYNKIIFEKNMTQAQHLEKV